MPEGIGLFVTQAAVNEISLIQQGLVRKKHSKAAVFREAMEFIQSECTILREEPSDNLPPKAKKAKMDVDSESAPTELSPQLSLLQHVTDDSRVYVVATQDEDLLDRLRAMGTVPIMRLANNSVLLLEQPSRASQKQAKGEERSKWKDDLPAAEKALVDLAKEKSKTITIVDTTNPTTRGRKKRKAKGPNPLSCKRKQP
jgi:rRNA-processing protein FCF1